MVGEQFAEQAIAPKKCAVSPTPGTAFEDQFAAVVQLASAPLPVHVNGAKGLIPNKWKNILWLNPWIEISAENKMKNEYLNSRFRELFPMVKGLIGSLG
jgi:hypothetical protein